MTEATAPDALHLRHWRNHAAAGWSLRRAGAAKPMLTFRLGEKVQAIAQGVRMADAMGIPLEVYGETGAMEGFVRPLPADRSGVGS